MISRLSEAYTRVASEPSDVNFPKAMESTAVTGEMNRQVRVPLTEVAYGAHFVAPQFSVVHFGEYFERIKDRFPTHRDVVPIARQSSPILGEMEVPTLPRVWYEHDTRLIQLQVDRFIYNWRRIPEIDEPYPGFETISTEFKSEWSAFLKFADDSFSWPLQLDQLNLHYVNHIEDVDTLDTPIFIFRENEWRRELPEPEFWASQFRFLFPDDNTKVTVSARPAIQIATQKRITQFDLLIESISAPNAKDFSAFSLWFDVAHGKVHSSFKKLIRPEWLAQWGF